MKPRNWHAVNAILRRSDRFALKTLTPPFPEDYECPQCGDYLDTDGWCPDCDDCERTEE